MSGVALLNAITITCAGACVALALWSGRRVPAIALASVGALAGGLAGLVYGSAEGRPPVQVAVSEWALLGLVGNGVVGAFVARASGGPRRLGRAGAGTLLAMPFATALFAWLLRTACPLYVRGKGSGACNYHHQDLLGGWSSVAILAFALAVTSIGVLLLVSSRQARRADPDADD